MIFANNIIYMSKNQGISYKKKKYYIGCSLKNEIRSHR